MEISDESPSLSVVVSDSSNLHVGMVFFSLFQLRIKDLPRLDMRSNQVFINILFCRIFRVKGNLVPFFTTVKLKNVLEKV